MLLFVKVFNFLAIVAPYIKGNFLLRDCLQNVNRNTTKYVISVILVRVNSFQLFTITELGGYTFSVY